MSDESIKNAKFDLIILEPYQDEMTKMKFQCLIKKKHIFELMPCAFVKRNYTCVKCGHAAAVKKFRSTYWGSIQTMLSDLRKVDREKNMENQNDLDFKWVQERLEKQNKKCYYSDIDIEFIDSGPYKISIDRLDNSIGHRKENCVITVGCINAFKNSMNHDEFIMYIKKIKSPSNGGFTEYKLLHEREKKSITNIMSKVRKPGKREKRSTLGRSIDHSTFETFRHQYQDKCVITGIYGTWRPNEWNTLSIDRINSDGPYEMINCQLVLKHVNFLKGPKMTNDMCKEIIDKIYNNITSGNLQLMYNLRTIEEIFHAEQMIRDKGGLIIYHSEFESGDWNISCVCSNSHEFSISLATLEEGLWCYKCQERKKNKLK